MPRTSRKRVSDVEAVSIEQPASRRRRKVDTWDEPLYDFVRDYGIAPDVRPQPHIEMLSWVDNLMEPLWSPRVDQEQTKGLLMVPRGCYKTTGVTVGTSLKVLRKNPNARILIDSHTHDYSKQILQEIKHHLVNNEAFTEHFGDWKADSPKWAEDAIIVGTRTRGLKEPSIDTSGVDKSKNGGHYDLIIADDLHEERNVANEGMRKKVRDHIQNLYPILEPGGVLLIIGTRWHNADAYDWLLKRNAEAVKKGRPAPYRTLVRGAFDGPDGTLYFPEKLSDEFLAQQRLELDDKKFAVWYLNQPVEDSSKFFTPDLIKYYEASFGVDRGLPFLEFAA